MGLLFLCLTMPGPLLRTFVCVCNVGLIFRCVCWFLGGAGFRFAGGAFAMGCFLIGPLLFTDEIIAVLGAGVSGRLIFNPPMSCGGALLRGGGSLFSGGKLRGGKGLFNGGGGPPSGDR